MLRFLITGIVAAVLLGGIAWFNFSFKPNMIKTIMSSQVPPPATVTSEAAQAEQWIEQLTSIGTLISSHGVDITSQVAGIVTEVYVESGAGRRARQQRSCSSTSPWSWPISPAARPRCRKRKLPISGSRT